MVKTMGDTPTGNVVGTAVPALVMGIAAFMVLTQLKIAPPIVQITYIALIGSHRLTRNCPIKSTTSSTQTS